VIDIALPDINGLDVCERMRARTQVPIILIADKVSDVDKVYGLNAGADDYITKPISNEELTARVHVIFKRQHLPERTSEPVVIGDLYIDFARREVFLASKPLELTRIEYDLLYTLIINRGQVLTHRQLLEKVWGPEYEDETQYLWVNISRLRKKLEPKPESSRYIHNQPGIGYFFEAP
jgi:two-component system, OmpR family, KDP operon response regulator KdpE